jgi:hypothetical protein
MTLTGLHQWLYFMYKILGTVVLHSNDVGLAVEVIRTFRIQLGQL